LRQREKARIDFSDEADVPEDLIGPALRAAQSNSRAAPSQPIGRRQKLFLARSRTGDVHRRWAPGATSSSDHPLII
jgi:hypothetical protein